MTEEPQTLFKEEKKDPGEGLNAGQVLPPPRARARPSLNLVSLPPPWTNKLPAR